MCKFRKLCYHVKVVGEIPDVMCSRTFKKDVSFLGRSFYLRLGRFLLTVSLGCLRSIGLVFLLTVEIRFGLFCLRRKIGVVFLTYGSPFSAYGWFSPSGNWVWSSLLTVSPPYVKKRTVSKKTSTATKKTCILSTFIYDVVLMCPWSP